jgi:hypothetical protein
MDYRELRKRLEERRMQSHRDFQPACVNIEAFISLMLEASDEVKAKYLRNYSPASPVPEKETFLLFLSYRTAHYFVASYELFLDALPDPAYGLLRVVLESGLTMRAVRNSDKLDKFYIRYFQLSKKLGDKLRTGSISAEVLELDKELRKLTRSGTTIRNLAEELYEGDARERLKIMETELDARSHANVTGALANLGYNPQAQEDLIRLMEAFASFCALSFLNAFRDELSEPTKARINDLASVLSSSSGVTIPLPNKK